LLYHSRLLYNNTIVIEIDRFISWDKVNLVLRRNKQILQRVMRRVLLCSTSHRIMETYLSHVWVERLDAVVVDVYYDRVLYNDFGNWLLMKLYR